MDNTERKFHWCLEKGKTGGRKHRGLRKIKPDMQEAENHIQKALHNLKAVDYNIKGGFGDWAVSAAFYAMYHSLLAILFKLGYDSRNQECTINAIDYFIRAGKIKLNLLSPAIHGGVVNSPIRGDSKGIASPLNKRYSKSENYQKRYETTGTILTGAKSPAIYSGEYLLDPKYVAMIRRTDELMGSDAKALREEFQYGTEIEVEDEVLKSMQNNANEFVESARVILEEIKA